MTIYYLAEYHDCNFKYLREPKATTGCRKQAPRVTAVGVAQIRGRGPPRERRMGVAAGKRRTSRTPGPVRNQETPNYKVHNIPAEQFLATEAEWRGATRMIHAVLGLPADLENFGVHHAYVDARQLTDSGR